MKPLPIHQKTRHGRPRFLPLPPRDVRSGYSLLELVVAMILLATVMTIVIPTLGWMKVHNRLALQREEALQGLHNLMDDLTSRPYQDLNSDAAAKVELTPALKRQLPGANLQVQIQEDHGEGDKAAPQRKQIHLELSWNQPNGHPLAPLRLTAWVHQREGQR